MAWTPTLTRGANYLALKPFSACGSVGKSCFAPAAGGSQNCVFEEEGGLPEPLLDRLCRLLVHTGFPFTGGGSASPRMPLVMGKLTLPFLTLFHFLKFQIVNNSFFLL